MLLNSNEKIRIELLQKAIWQCVESHVRHDNFFISRAEKKRINSILNGIEKSVKKLDFKKLPPFINLMKLNKSDLKTQKNFFLKDKRLLKKFSKNGRNRFLFKPTFIIYGAILSDYLNTKEIESILDLESSNSIYKYIDKKLSQSDFQINIAKITLPFLYEDEHLSKSVRRIENSFKLDLNKEQLELLKTYAKSLFDEKIDNQYNIFFPNKVRTNIKQIDFDNYKQLEYDFENSTSKEIQKKKQSHIKLITFHELLDFGNNTDFEITPLNFISFIKSKKETPIVFID